MAAWRAKPRKRMHCPHGFAFSPINEAVKVYFTVQSFVKNRCSSLDQNISFWRFVAEKIAAKSASNFVNTFANKFTHKFANKFINKFAHKFASKFANFANKFVNKLANKFANKIRQQNLAKKFCMFSPVSPALRAHRPG